MSAIRPLLSFAPPTRTTLSGSSRNGQAPRLAKAAIGRGRNIQQAVDNRRANGTFALPTECRLGRFSETPSIFSMGKREGESHARGSTGQPSKVACVSPAPIAKATSERLLGTSASARRSSRSERRASNDGSHEAPRLGLSPCTTSRGELANTPGLSQVVTVRVRLGSPSIIKSPLLMASR